MKKEKKHRLARAAAAAAGVPVTVFADLPEISLSGGRELRVEGPCGVLLYTGQCILIDGGELRLCVRGAGLWLDFIGTQALCARGRIDSVEIERAEG